MLLAWANIFLGLNLAEAATSLYVGAALIIVFGLVLFTFGAIKLKKTHVPRDQSSLPDSDTPLIQS